MVDPDKLANTIFPEEILFKNKLPKIATIKTAPYVHIIPELKIIKSG